MTPRVSDTTRSGRRANQRYQYPPRPKVAEPDWLYPRLSGRVRTRVAERALGASEHGPECGGASVSSRCSRWAAR